MIEIQLSLLLTIGIGIALFTVNTHALNVGLLVPAGKNIKKTNRSAISEAKARIMRDMSHTPIKQSKQNTNVMKTAKQFVDEESTTTTKAGVKSGAEEELADEKKTDKLRSGEPSFIVISNTTTPPPAPPAAFASNASPPPPSIGYLGTGYDRIKGNPYGSGGVLDPGFRAPVVVLEYFQSNLNGDMEFLVPNHGYIHKVGTCHASSRASCITNSAEYQASLSTQSSSSGASDFSLGVGLGFEGFGVTVDASMNLANERSFTASSGFQSETSTISSGTMESYDTVAKCTEYEAGFTDVFALKLQPDLVHSFNALPTTLTTTAQKAAYGSFISTYGTHMTFQVEFGGKHIDRQTISKSEVAILVSKQVDVASTAAQSTSFGVSVSGGGSVLGVTASASGNTATNTAQATNNAQSQAAKDAKSLSGSISNHESITIGGTPPGDGAWQTWAASITARPVPITYKTIPLPLMLIQVDGAKAVVLAKAIETYAVNVGFVPPNAIPGVIPTPLGGNTKEIAVSKLIAPTIQDTITWGVIYIGALQFMNPPKLSSGKNIYLENVDTHSSGVKIDFLPKLYGGSPAVVSGVTICVACVDLATPANFGGAVFGQIGRVYSYVDAIAPKSVHIAAVDSEKAPFGNSNVNFIAGEVNDQFGLGIMMGTIRLDGETTNMYVNSGRGRDAAGNFFYKVLYSTPWTNNVVTILSFHSWAGAGGPGDLTPKSLLASLQPHQYHASLWQTGFKVSTAVWQAFDFITVDVMKARSNKNIVAAYYSGITPGFLGDYAPLALTATRIQTGYYKFDFHGSFASVPATFVSMHQSMGGPASLCQVLTSSRTSCVIRCINELNVPTNSIFFLLAIGSNFK